MRQIAFKDSQEAAFRRFVRDAIKRGPFTKSERDVTLAVVNHWLHHKGGPKPFIHPSRESMAKKAGVSVKTVSRALDLLRMIGGISAVSSIKGGKGKATQYRVNAWQLMAYCGCDWVDEFTRGATANVSVSTAKCLGMVGTKCPTVLRDVPTHLSQVGDVL
jgi:hypothetical protein